MRSIEAMVNAQFRVWDLRKGFRFASSHHEKKAETRALPSPVIAIAPQYGSSANKVIDILSRRTGYEAWGFKLIDKVAEDMQISSRLIERMDERQRSIIRNMIDSMLVGRHVEQTQYFRRLLQVIQTFVMEGGCMLIGRGAPCVVSKGQGIRVRLVASPSVRIANVMEMLQVDETEAAHKVKVADEERASFLQRFYDKDIDDPVNYDITINMDRMDARTTADLILDAMEHIALNHEPDFKLFPQPWEPEELINRTIVRWDRQKMARVRADEDFALSNSDSPEAGRRLPVVAFASRYGSGARLVSEVIHYRLGYEVFGYKILDRVCEDLQLSPKILGRLDEQGKTAVQSFIDGIMVGHRVSREDYFRSLIRVVRALIIQGGVTLMGRGLTHIVEPGEGVRVFITASQEKRLANLSELRGLDGAQAEDRLAKRDKDMEDFLRQYFNVRYPDLCHFDMTINMDRLNHVTAADVVQRALDSLPG